MSDREAILWEYLAFDPRKSWDRTYLSRYFYIPSPWMKGHGSLFWALTWDFILALLYWYVVWYFSIIVHGSTIKHTNHYSLNRRTVTLCLTSFPCADAGPNSVHAFHQMKLEREEIRWTIWAMPVNCGRTGRTSIRDCFEWVFDELWHCGHDSRKANKIYDWKLLSYLKSTISKHRQSTRPTPKVTTM